MNVSAVSYDPYDDTPSIQLTPDQQHAYNELVKFLLDPHQDVFVLGGYSGTGKTTLVKVVRDNLHRIEKTVRLLRPDFSGFDEVYTATTNKAAEVLSEMLGTETVTIQSLLGLRVNTDYYTGKTRLVAKAGIDPVRDRLIFIDEASFVDQELLRQCFARTENCKLVFMGDPAQLAPVGYDETPVFSSRFPGATLTQVVRQAEGNPIIDLATRFREMVTSKEWFQFTPDGQAIVWLPPEQFLEALHDEFTHPDWRHNTSKVLAWTNKTVNLYNQQIRSWVQGAPELDVGDYACVNAYVPGRPHLKTDQLVRILGKSSETCYSVAGHRYLLDANREVFTPNTLTDWHQRVARARTEMDFETLRDIEQNWCDLRAVYAQTINKAQGSTYDRVFIDLNDLQRVSDVSQLARLLYVGVSRARYQVIFTGDLV